MQSSRQESEETHTAVAPETERGETSLHALENETTMVGDAVRRTSIESLPDRRPQTVAVGDLEIRDFEGTTVVITPPMYPLVYPVTRVII